MHLNKVIFYEQHLKTSKTWNYANRKRVIHDRIGTIKKMIVSKRGNPKCELRIGDVEITQKRKCTNRGRKVQKKKMFARFNCS